MTPDTKVADSIAELHEQAEPGAGQVWPPAQHKIVFAVQDSGSVLSRKGCGLLLARIVEDGIGTTVVFIGSNPFGREFVFDMERTDYGVSMTDAQARELVGAEVVADIDRRIKEADESPFEIEPLAALLRPAMTAKHEDWKKNHREAEIKANAEYEAKRGAERAKAILSEHFPVDESKANESRADIERRQAESGPITDKFDARQVGITIKNCGACDGTHEGVKVNEFTRPSGPFTHWFTCPNLQDPVNITLGLLSNGEGLQLDGPILQTLARAQLCGMYMVIVCEIDPSQDHKMTLTRHTHKFPSGDVYQTKSNLGFMGLLKENLEQEFGPAQPVEMKEVRPQPLRDLMGNLIDRAKEAQEVPAASLGDRVSEAMQTLPPQ